MHAPRRARALVRRLSAGEDPTRLLDEARQVGEAGQEARALLRIAADPRLPVPEVAAVAQDVAARIGRIERPSARAEAIEELFPRVAALRADVPDPTGALRAARAHLTDRFVAAAVALPDGPWLQTALQATLPSGDPRILHRAEGAGLGPVCRAFVQAHGGLDRLRAVRMRAHCGDLDAVWESGDAEVARVVAWAPDTDPLAFARSAEGRDAASRVTAYTLGGARLDRDGGDGRPFLDQAQALLPEVPDVARPRLARKLNAAREKAGLAPALVDSTPPQATHGAFPVRPRPGRDVLGLVDASEGRLGLVHLRAAARAAPLCVAFDLDLGLYGFPIRDLASFVSAAEAETRIGDGATHLRDLYRQGRVHVEEEWPGTVVATTPRPDAAKRGGLPAGRIVLLVGLGHNGLPKRYLEGAAVHYEITGAEVSLETATAMGILADRLARRRSG